MLICNFKILIKKNLKLKSIFLTRSCSKHTLNDLNNEEEFNLNQELIKSNKMSQLKIISNGYMSSPKSCMLIFDSKRYLINCGENMQRLVVSNHLKPKKIENILLTRFDWKSIGGLNGLSLELEDSHNINLHSSKDFYLDSTSSSIKKYLFSKKMKLNQHDYTKNPTFSDDNVEINKINIKDSFCSYLVTIKKPEPKLIMEKIEKYNIKPGRWLANLKKGIDYELPSGEIIRSADVLDYTNSHEKKILFVDCPDQESIENLSTNDLINQDNILMIIHMADSNILNSKTYLNWLRNYKKTCKNCIHLFLDETYPNIDLIKMYEMQAQLNLINEDIFQLLPVQLNSFKLLQKEYSNREKEIRKDLKIIQAQTNMIFELMPNFHLDLDNLFQIDNREFQQQILEFYENNLKLKIDGIDENEQKILDKFRFKIENFKQDEQMNNKIKSSQIEYPSIVILGSASALPSMNRGLSSVFVNINENVNIMLDCGEGTVCQLNKFYSDDIYNELVKLKLLFISHYHYDHFNGLYGLILKRIESFKILNKPYEKLYVLYSRNLMNHLNGNHLIFGDKFNEYVDLIPNDYFYSLNNKKSNQLKVHDSNNDFLKKIKKNFETNFGLKSIETILVKHIYQSYGICLKLAQENADDFKLVYSGDCRPSNDLAKIGQNCDLLIHECTFDNKFLDDAISKSHSTIGEALDVSCKMNAKMTLLTHFSLRYGKIINIDDVNKNNVGIAFDFMRLSPKHFNLLNKFINEFKVAFKDHSEINENRKIKKKKI